MSESAIAVKALFIFCLFFSLVRCAKSLAEFFEVKSAMPKMFEFFFSSSSNAFFSASCFIFSRTSILWWLFGAFQAWIWLTGRVVWSLSELMST